VWNPSQVCRVFLLYEQTPIDLLTARKTRAMASYCGEQGLHCLGGILVGLMFTMVVLAGCASRPKPNVRVMKGNSVKMTDILHQKAFEVYALEASRVTDTSFVLAAFVCSLICVIKQKRVPISFLSHSDALTIQHNRWNYRAK